MPASFRFVLLASAALCTAFVALLGGGFSRAVEPDSYSTGTSAFWLFCGALVASPLWVPAVFPARYPRALRVCRWLSAAALLVPILMFGGIVSHNIQRSISGLGASPSALAEGVLLTATCLLCMVLLLWPKLSKLAKRAT